MTLRSRAVAVFGLVVACNQTVPPKTDAAAAPAAPAVVDAGLKLEPASSTALDAAPPPLFALRDLPNPKPPGTGPINVENYPSTVDSSMSDPAHAFGFMHDGKTFVYCQTEICCRDGAAECLFYDENGKERAWRSPIMVDGDPIPPNVERKSLTEIREFPKKEGLARLTPTPKSAMEQRPPPVTGTIPYGDELTLVYRVIPISEDAQHNIKSPGSIRMGGKLPGEAAVYPAGIPLPVFCTKFPQSCMHAELNGISVSPGGDELAFLAYTHNPSHGSSFSFLRLKATELAAMVFNDTGMTHHKKKEWAKAAELFTRAVYADPTKELFAYNLACALAQKGDARAESALAHAIKLGGDPVKKRAMKDADFASARDAPWFAAATR